MQFQHQGKKNFDKFFDKSVINKIGVKSGFILRKPQKIHPYHFVIGFIMSCSKGQNTFSQWALEISILSRKVLSKQGVFERIHKGATTFAKQLLEHVLKQQLTNNFASTLFDKFNKVVLQDSTTLRLPQILSSIFKGNYSSGEQRSVARIQSIFDIKAMSFIKFSLGSFTENDQSTSSGILPLIKKDDLVIRDMGYFSLAVFQKIIAVKAHFLSRLKYGVTISDKYGKVLLLKELFKQKNGVDKWVYIGTDKKVWVRLVIIPMPSNQASERIRKARQNRDARLNHSKAYYEWLKFSIYITSVDEEVWSKKEVYQAYKVRWQIEIIFKSWKTGFSLQKILHEGCTNVDRVYVSIYLMLLYMCLVMRKIYVAYKTKIERKSYKKLSIMKLAIFVKNNIKEILSLSVRYLNELIMKYCCFETRYDRVNMTDLYHKNKN